MGPRESGHYVDHSIIVIIYQIHNTCNETQINEIEISWAFDANWTKNKEKKNKKKRKEL